MILFGFGAVLGLGMLGFGTVGFGPGPTSVVVWGTIPREVFDDMQRAVGLSDNDDVNVVYVERRVDTFDNDLVNALARGEGPDVFFISHENLVLHRDKIYTIPYETLPRRTFQNTFIAQSELLLSPEGMYAVPLVVDPMVTYWNTRLFNNASISRPPQYWDELYDLIPRLTVIDTNLNIRQSAFALGEAGNVSHFDDIITGLWMQNGISVASDHAERRYRILIEGEDKLAIISSLNYYTQFSNPSSDFYTWNRSLPQSQDYFAQEDLALYFGYASELDTLRAKNPNMRFDVAPFLQSREGLTRITPGKLTGLAITQQSRRKDAAFIVIQALTSVEGAQFFANLRGVAPARPDAFVQAGGDTITPVVQQMALWARGWLNPDVAKVGMVMQDMIDSITSGRRRNGEAVDRFIREVDTLYSPFNS